MPEKAAAVRQLISPIHNLGEPVRFVGADKRQLRAVAEENLVALKIEAG